MKRDPRLIEFSREHHLALKLGSTLAKAKDLEAGNAAVDEYRTFLLAHFLEEERDLLEIIKKIGNDAVGEQFLQDHKVLREFLQQKNLSLEALQEFGKQLIAHTRFEERELFTLIQEFWDQSDEI
ncbi:hemerythrin HHE cation-binding protein [Ignatzschineria rhizosphaerae]|uniref:Hemerythrin HHE cation-binding protein n=1 Tax=Ignatzschineria rhizosphaerae TaxID=2923279 RepID=A0ABY3X5V7_9GAMM|nr:hemerythrin HHE cation-binding protein [Ignatzschineria rhizosphaerae]UNM97146.1 hemerythrin HHE cation-binding protein [Ignatzschineria rhizosphaerae]